MTLYEREVFSGKADKYPDDFMILPDPQKY